MKKSVVFTVAITFAIILVAWNVYLSMNINKYRKHPEKINIFLQQDDSIAQQISSIEDSLGVSIIVSDYENSQLDQTIGVLNNITTFFGHILAALAIFIAIIAALGLYEINNWRVLRKEIEEGEAKVNNLTLRVHTSIEQIDQRKNAFENNIKEIEKYDQSLDLKVKEFYDRLKNTQRELEFTISNFNEKQNEIIQDNFLFKEFKNNIFELFRKFRSKISKFLDEDLKKVKDANATESEYSEDLKRTLIDFLTFYNFFGALLKTISNEKLPLKDIDYFALGMAAYSVRSYDDSREFFEKAVEINPNDHIIFFRLGVICYLLKDYENAIVNLDKAIILCPEFPAANYNKGTVYKSMGKFDKAISAYKEAIKNKENYYEAYNSLAAMYIKTKEFKEAESILDNLIASNNQNSKAYYNKACLFSLQKNKEFALIYLEKAIKLDSELKKAAIKDEDFSWLKETEEFIALSS